MDYVAVSGESGSAERESEGMSSELGSVLERLNALTNWERNARGHMRIDLLPVSDLLTRLGERQTRFRSVHVGGTKGKGSVCCLVDAGLRHAGFHVGRYASPHLERINERVCLRGEQICDADFASALSLALDAFESASAACSAGTDATWFDVMTAAAFSGFARAGVDWAVVEVGLGGRLDSTNVLKSDVAVLTNVGLEHTDVLGDTVEVIATEKAGIIKPGAVVVTPIAAESPEGRIVFQSAARCGASVHPVVAPDEVNISELNLMTAREVLRSLGLRDVASPRRRKPLGVEDLPAEVAEHALLPGRMERRVVASSQTGREVEVVLDGAHVDFALVATLRELRQQPRLQSMPVVLMSLGADKNAPLMVRSLKALAARVVFVELRGVRQSWPAERLVEIATALGIPSETARTPDEAWGRCMEVVDDRWILVTGSLYLVGALRATVIAAERSRAAGHP